MTAHQWQYSDSNVKQKLDRQATQADKQLKQVVRTVWCFSVFSQRRLVNENYKLGCRMFLWMNVFTLSLRLACNSQRHERLLRILYWLTSNHILFRFGCRPREASRSKPTMPRPKPTRPRPQPTRPRPGFFDLEDEARPRGLTSLK